jgi:lysophospholipase L1-like esterase
MKNSQDIKNHFYTHFPIKEQYIWTNPDRFFFMGSCFSTNISEKFNDHFIETLANPFGTIFSPDALAQTLQHIQNQTLPTVIHYQNTEHALLFDTSFQHAKKDILETQIKERLHETLDYLSKCNTVFITLGSAWVYRHLETNELVGNCHKFPAANFEKRLSESNEIIAAFTEMIAVLKNVNPSLKIVFTVSPVRHINHGIIENNLSKARLLEAVHAVQNEVNVSYFPSYEIVVDELRDYRFYKTDRVHPTEEAVAYVWKRISELVGSFLFIYTLHLHFNSLNSIIFSIFSK